MATRAAYDAFLRTYADPEGEQTRDQFEDRRSRYRMLWHYYLNSAFEDNALWERYKSKYKLHRQIRSLYNPTRRLVDFYTGIVYPGVLSIDAERLPNGAQLAIPFAEDTNPQLLRAVGEFWRWSNWQINKNLMIRYGAALGDVLVELVDDVAGGKVFASVTWPGLIDDLLLDEQGNVKMYALEYDYEIQVTDFTAQKYTYRKEVDQNSIRTFRDGEPFSYNDVPAVVPNEYGFVPAIWVKHVDLGGDHGEPALRNVGKIDQLNSLASAMVDHATRNLEAPVIISNAQGLSRLFSEQRKRTSTREIDDEEGAGDRESIKILKATGDARIQTVELNPGEALATMDHLIAEIEKDHPEITMFAQLRGMAQVTGPAADRLFGDVETYVNDARAIYDTQSIKLFQMAVAIAGWRVQNGDWGDINRQQAAFAPFNLESYFAGDLDMDILPRPLIAPTRRETLELERMEQALELDRQGATFAQTAPQSVADRLRMATQRQAQGA